MFTTPLTFSSPESMARWACIRLMGLICVFHKLFGIWVASKHPLVIFLIKKILKVCDEERLIRYFWKLQICNSFIIWCRRFVQSNTISAKVMASRSYQNLLRKFSERKSLYIFNNRVYGYHIWYRYSLLQDLI